MAIAEIIVSVATIYFGYRLTTIQSRMVEDIEEIKLEIAMIKERGKRFRVTDND